MYRVTNYTWPFISDTFVKSDLSSTRLYSIVFWPKYSLQSARKTGLCLSVFYLWFVWCPLILLAIRQTPPRSPWFFPYNFYPLVPFDFSYLHTIRRKPVFSIFLSTSTLKKGQIVQRSGLKKWWRKNGNKKNI